jgi:glycosyltransferase involved in cell wall biosynthesis
MTPLTVIIPSRNVENLIPCVEAVRRHEPDVAIVVVDDFPGDGLDLRVGRGRDVLAANGGDSGGSLSVVPDIADMRKPFIFARNCNLGIAAAGGGDVVLLNDDAILESPGGFSTMQAAAAADPTIALVAATTNVVNNPAQYQRTSGGVRLAGRLPYTHFAAVAFVCVLIPGRTLEAIGLLDERYSAYGWEDVDYCRRIHEAGQKIVIDDRCFVDHSKLRSTFRGDPRAAGPIHEGRTIYIDKWGKL